jgi:hypothetical protein
MKRSARALAAVVTTAALTLTGQALATSAASAKPHHAGSHAKGSSVKGGTAALVRDITRLSAALDRTVRPSRIGTLAEDVQAAVVANVEADKQDLAWLAEDVAAAGGTVDVRQVRADLRDLRPENYVLSVNVLRKATRVGAAATESPEATALVQSAVDLALTVTATSPKSVLREARAALSAAEELLEPAVDPVTVTA